MLGRLTMFPEPPSLFLMGSKPNYSLLRRGCLLSSKGRHVLTRAWSILLSCCNSFDLSSGGVLTSHCSILFFVILIVSIFARLALPSTKSFLTHHYLVACRFLSRPRLPSSFYSGLMLGKKLRLSFRQILRLR
jgi:hypothetical protein